MSMRRFHLALTKDKIAHSPSIDWNKPVSRQHELNYSRYMGYSYYWGYPGVWGIGGYPTALAARGWSDALADDSNESHDTHLRSAREVRGYHVQGKDDAIGHVEDFIIDNETWELRYLVIDTKNWWFGRKVLIAPHWANGSPVYWDSSDRPRELGGAHSGSNPR